MWCTDVHWFTSSVQWLCWIPSNHMQISTVFGSTSKIYKPCEQCFLKYGTIQTAGSMFGLAKTLLLPPPRTSCQKKQNNALSVCLRLLSLLSTKGYQRLLRTWLDHASLCLFELQPVTSGRETGWGLCLIMQQSAAVCGERLWWLASCSEFGNPHLRQRSSTICYHEFIIRHHKASALTESNSHRLHNAKCDSVQRYLQDYILSPLYNNRALTVLISRDLKGTMSSESSSDVPSFIAFAGSRSWSCSVVKRCETVST